MRRILMVLGVLLMAAGTRARVASAQTLPGDGNCWMCSSIEVEGGGYTPQCMGAQSGAYTCRLDGYYPYLICITEGSGCSTSLADAGGWIEEVVPCSTIGIGAPAWWDWAISAGYGDHLDSNAFDGLASSPLLAPLALLAPLERLF